MELRKLVWAPHAKILQYCQYQTKIALFKKLRDLIEKISLYVTKIANIQ